VEIKVRHYFQDLSSFFFLPSPSKCDNDLLIFCAGKDPIGGRSGNREAKLRSRHSQLHRNHNSAAERISLSLSLIMWICSSLRQYFFSAFLKRDTTYEVLANLWKQNLSVRPPLCRSHKQYRFICCSCLPHRLRAVRGCSALHRQYTSAGSHSRFKGLDCTLLCTRTFIYLLLTSYRRTRRSRRTSIASLASPTRSSYSVPLSIYPSVHL
jgi:hypothetical protein